MISKLLVNKPFQKVFKLASKALFIKVSSGVLTLLMFIVIARVLSAEQFGLFGVGFSLALFASVVGSLGLGTLVMRLWPEYSVKGKHDMAMQVMLWASKKTLYFSFIPASLIILVFLIFDITEFKDLYNFSYGLSVAALIVSLAISEFISAALRAQKKLTLALAPKDIIWRLLVSVVFGVIYFLGIEVNAGQVLMGSAAMLITITIIQVYLSDLRGIIQSNESINSEYVSDWLTLAKPIWFGGIVFSSTMHADMLLVSFFLDAETIAAYFAALKIASVLALPILAINQLSGPMISRYFHAGDMITLQKNLALYLLFCTAIVLPMLLTIIIFGRELLSLFNPVFSDAYYVLIALSVGYLFHCLSGPAGVFLQMTGRSTLALKTSSTTQILALVIFPFAATAYGNIGVALTKMFEMACRNTVQSFQGKRIFGIHTSIACFFSKRLSMKKNEI